MIGEVQRFLSLTDRVARKSHFLLGKDEVDFVVGDAIAIQAKASEVISDRHLKGLRRLHEERPLVRRIVVSRERVARRTEDGIEILPVDSSCVCSGAANSIAPPQ